MPADPRLLAMRFGLSNIRSVREEAITDADSNLPIISCRTQL